MFEVPGASITEVHVTEDYVRGKSGPNYVRNVDTVGSTETTDEDEVNTSIRLKQ